MTTYRKEFAVRTEELGSDDEIQDALKQVSRAPRGPRHPISHTPARAVATPPANTTNHKPQLRAMAREACLPAGPTHRLSAALDAIMPGVLARVGKAIQITNKELAAKVAQIMVQWIAAMSTSLVATGAITFAVLAVKHGAAEALKAILLKLCAATTMQLIVGFAGGALAMLAIVAAIHLIRHHQTYGAMQDRFNAFNIQIADAGLENQERPIGSQVLEWPMAAPPASAAGSAAAGLHTFPLWSAHAQGIVPEETSAEEEPHGNASHGSKL